VCPFPLPHGDMALEDLVNIYEESHPPPRHTHTPATTTCDNKVRGFCFAVYNTEECKVV